MSDPIKTQLAHSLQIDPGDIRDYRQTADDAYTVLLTNFQKRTNVHPAEAEPESEAGGIESAADPAGRNALSEIPDHLLAAYGNPQGAKKADLAQLAVLLEIPLDMDNPLKKDLAAAIIAYQERPFDG